MKEIAAAVAAGATKKALWEKFFGTMARSHQGVYEGMRVLGSAARPSPEFKLADFPESWQELNGETRSLVLIGESGIGKTQFALACLPDALWCTHMDDLLSFDPQEHKGIIFDDMSFAHMPRTAQIHVSDWDCVRSIHCRYRSATIPAHTPKIFTCNEFPFTAHDSAIDRRLTVKHLEKFQ